MSEGLINGPHLLGVRMPEGWYASAGVTNTNPAVPVLLIFCSRACMEAAMGAFLGVETPHPAMMA